MSDRTSFEFTETEYKALVEMLQIADWVICCHDTTPSQATQPFRDIRAKILAEAAKMGLGHLIEYNSEMGQYYETREYEETGEHRQLIDEYDELSFWDNLVDNLARRDLVDEVGEDSYRAMEPMARFQRLHALQQGYEREFETEGLQNLRIVRQAIPPSKNGT